MKEMIQSDGIQIDIRRNVINCIFQWVTKKLSSSLRL